MTAILSLLTSRVGALVSAGLAFLFAFGLIGCAITIWSKNNQIDALQDSIDHPVTGWSARLTKAQMDLATSRANAATMEASLAHQNAAIAAEQSAGQARVLELNRVILESNAEAQTAQQRANAILHRARSGNPCADADAAILEATHE